MHIEQHEHSTITLINTVSCSYILPCAMFNYFDIAGHDNIPFARQVNTLTLPPRLTFEVEGLTLKPLVYVQVSSLTLPLRLTIRSGQMENY